jgi:type IV pilus assembly protein PilY1
VGRLFTKEDSRPAQWNFSKVTTEDIGPVTATVSKLLDTEGHKMWLYFGTGRYFYEESNGADDGSGQRHIIGLKDPCYYSTGFDTSDTASCLSTQLTLTNHLTDVTNDPSTTTEPSNGWYISLDPAGSYGPYANPTDPLRAYNAERSVTDPSASTRGLAYFTTYKPYNDDCALTGRTYIWAVKYDTGGAATNLLTGTIVIQLSTGQIAQVNLSTAFNEAGGRRAGIGIGAPPGPGGGIIAPRSAVKKTVHVRER